MSLWLIALVVFSIWAVIFINVNVSDEYGCKKEDKYEFVGILLGIGFRIWLLYLVINFLLSYT